MTVTVGADPTEEVPLPITVSWSASVTAYAYLTVKPAGGLACAPNYGADDPNSRDVIYNAGGATTGSRSTNEDFEEPGTFTLCGYLQNGSSALLKATGPITLVVRSARAAVTLAAPARVDAGQTFPLAAGVITELRRTLFVTVKPAGGRGCEPNYSADDPNSLDFIYNSNVQGSTTVSNNVTASQTNGTYLLCAYVQEGSSDTAPEATTSALFAVGPDLCKAARSALTTAKSKLKSAQTAVTRARRAVARHTAAARRGSRSSRRHQRALARAARKRYSSALRRRASARRSVASGEAAVKTTCG